MNQSVSAWDSVQQLSELIEKHIHNLPHVLAGFKGNGIDVVDEIHDFAADQVWTIQTIDKVKHMNADQAWCGYGCSGNPYDAYWSFDPLGHGDIHELGHGLEDGRLRLTGWEVHATTNPYSYYSKSIYHRDTGNDPDCQNLPFSGVFTTLQDSIGQADPINYLQTNLWDGSNWSIQVMLLIQSFMSARHDGG